MIGFVVTDLDGNSQQVFRPFTAQWLAKKPE